MMRVANAVFLVPGSLTVFVRVRGAGRSRPRPPNDFFANADSDVTAALRATPGDLNGAHPTEPGEFQFLNCSRFAMQQTVWYRLPAVEPPGDHGRT